MNLNYETPKDLVEKYLLAENKSAVLDEIEFHRKEWIKSTISELKQNVIIPPEMSLEDLITLFEILKNEFEINKLKSLVNLA